MATLGKYCDVTTTLTLHEDGSGKALLQLRRGSSAGMDRDDYILEHDNGFPVTILQRVAGTPVMRHNFRGPSEFRPPRRSDVCPDEEVRKNFRLEKVVEGKDDAYRLILDDGDIVKNVRWFPDFNKITAEAIAKEKEEKEKQKPEQEEKKVKHEDEPDDDY